MVQLIITIARNTFVEAVRQPIFVAMLLVGGVAMVLMPFLSAYTFEDDNKLLVELGLSTLFLLGLVTAGFTATAAISEEIENHTALTTISKPVPRFVFVLGKFAGVAAAVVLAYWITAVAFLFAARTGAPQNASYQLDTPPVLMGFLVWFFSLIFAAITNYFYRWVFTSTFVASLSIGMTVAWILSLMIHRDWTFQSPTAQINVQTMLALLLVLEAVLMLAAIAVAASTRMGQVTTLVLCVVVTFLGLASQYVHQQVVTTLGESDYSAITRFTGLSLAHGLYAIVPNFQALWPTEDLTLDNPLSPGYVLWASGYAGLYILSMLAMAVGLFQTREVS